MSFLPDKFYEGVHIVFDTLFVAGLRERVNCCLFLYRGLLHVEQLVNLPSHPPVWYGMFFPSKILFVG